MQYDKRKNPEILIYKKNTLPYKILLLSILAEVVYLASILDNMIASFMLGITIMVNILILFTMFTCAIKINMYNEFWNKIGFTVGIYLLLRIIIFIPFILKPVDRLEIITLSSIVQCALVFSASVISLIQTRKRRQAIKKNKQRNENGLSRVQKC